MVECWAHISSNVDVDQADNITQFLLHVIFDVACGIGNSLVERCLVENNILEFDSPQH